MLQILLLVIVIGLLAGQILRWVREEGFEGDVPVDPGDRYDEDPDDVGDDPRDLPWIATWSAADRVAREGQICMPTYEEIGPLGTMIYTTSKSCEAGMPHTRAGDRIIIPDSVPLPARAEVLAHELVHIHQRRYGPEWIRFYQMNWQFTFSAEPPANMPIAIQQARRSNPDTWDPQSGGPWPCWRDRWWPVPVYRDAQRPQLRDAQTIWWDDKTRQILLEPPEEWIQFFGLPSQDEHPHELTATLYVASDTATEAVRRLQSWARSQKNPLN